MKLPGRVVAVVGLLLALFAVAWLLYAPTSTDGGAPAPGSAGEVVVKVKEVTAGKTPVYSGKVSYGVRPLLSNGSALKGELGDSLQYSKSKSCWDECGTPCSLVTGEPICPSECDEDNECEADELCTVGATQADGDRRWRCQKSHCVVDDDCGAEKACVRMARPEGEVWLCARAGVREIGESCAHDEFAPIGLCQRGLQCSNGICVPNECDADSLDDECGPGARCLHTEVGMGSCSPACDSEEDCRSGETCATHQSHLKKRCLRPHAFGCILSGCPDPEAECILNSDGLTLKTTSCMRRCKNTGDCREEEVCGVQGDDVNTYCYLECGGELGGCNEGWYCPIDVIKSEGEFVRSCVRDVLGSELEFFELISKESEEAE